MVLKRLALISWLCIGAIACHHAINGGHEQPWGEKVESMEIIDVGDRLSLLEAVKAQIGFVEKKGGDIPVDQLKALQSYLESVTTLNGLSEWLNEKFELRQSSGGPFLVTGYYLPEIKAAKEQGGEFNFPIHAVPEDLVTVKVADFPSAKPRKNGLENLELVGKVVEKKLVPYETRDDLETNKEVIKRLVPVAWLRSEFDRYNLQLQGSGRLVWPDGSSQIAGYAASNGYPMVMLGKLMVDDGVLKKRDVTMQAITQYFAKKPERWREYARRMPRTIFFQLRDNAVGAMQLPLVGWRTVAVDPEMIPYGSIGYLVARQPVVDSKGRVVEWKPLHVLVFAHDTGAAIRGKHLDLYMGTGETAAATAGVMREEGQFFLMVPKTKNPEQKL